MDEHPTPRSTRTGGAGSPGEPEQMVAATLRDTLCDFVEAGASKLAATAVHT